MNKRRSSTALVILCCLVSTSIPAKQKHKHKKNTSVAAQESRVAKDTEKQTGERLITMHCVMTPHDIQAEYKVLGKSMGKYMPNSFALITTQPASHEVSEKNTLFSYEQEKVTKKLETLPVVIKDNTIEFEYEYSFACGLYKAKKRASFEVPADADSIEVSFSFNDDRRVLIPQARLLKPIEAVS